MNGFLNGRLLLFLLFLQGLLEEYGTLSFAHQSMLSVIIIGGAFLGLMIIIPTFNVLAYLSLDQTIHYQTQYHIVSLGPERLKAPQCEYGIRIKEIYTGGWVFWCIRDPKSKTKENTGTVWVTAKTGPIGADIVDYQFYPMSQFFELTLPVKCTRGGFHTNQAGRNIRDGL